MSFRRASHGIAVSLLVFLLSLLLSGAGTIETQETSVDELADSIEAFIDGALRIHINARIVDSELDETVWTMDLTRVTIGGRSVRVRLDGANIIVVADFTPYWENEEELLLVAQGQTWLLNRNGQGDTTYRTSFTTLPIRLGEPIIFLPLGTTPVAGDQPDLDTNHVGQLNIELEIYVERYQS